MTDIEAKLSTDINKIKEKIRGLKDNKAPKEEVQAAVAEMKKMQAELELERKKNEKPPVCDRPQLEDLLKRRFFYVQAFEIYGGVAGLYDFGPPGCAVKANVLGLWRKHFVLQENMLEVDCTNLTPEICLKASGHVDKFTDLMVRDLKTLECYRADHLLEDEMEKLMADKKIDEAKKKEYLDVSAQVDNYSPEELAEKLKQYNVKAPDTGNDLSEPYPFNLMFGTSIGPAGNLKGFFRPETAQGIFVNFRRLLDFNGGRVPFAAAQIGLGFRNEIAPRSGLLRVREFPMAEIEHFVHPEKKDHPSFESVKDTKILLFPREQQITTHKMVEMTMGDAVGNGVIANQTLGYFIARTFLFLRQCGIQYDRLRFRQHLLHEMAHYAADCWDAEIETTYGWIECVGHADRSCYDLQQHTAMSKVELVAREEFAEPRKVDVIDVNVNKGLVGRHFKKDAQKVMEYLNTLTEEEKVKVKADFESGNLTIKLCSGEEFTLEEGMVTFKSVNKTITGQNFCPSVIEPSFGIGRIMYCIFEHSYYSREEEDTKEKEKGKTASQRGVLALTPSIAPVKVSIMPLSPNPQFRPLIDDLNTQLVKLGLTTKVDDSGVSIGRRYARTDEIGVPFGVTIDFQSVEDKTATLRERDSMSQVRIPIDEIAKVMFDVIHGDMDWKQISEKYPAYEGGQAE